MTKVEKCAFELTNIVVQELLYIVRIMRKGWGFASL